MRLLICGSRDWNDKLIITQYLERLQPSVVIEGEAPGADTLARQAAKALDIKVEAYPADWRLHGRSAGMVRNQQMLDEGKPDYVLAFHDHIELSRGTKDMVNRAEEAGLPVAIWTHGSTMIWDIEEKT